MRTRLLLAALLTCLLVPAVALAGDDGKDEAKLKERLEKLEKENEKLRDELAKHKADTKKVFDDATRAEKTAALDFRRPTAVAATSTAATVPPIRQPATKHAGVRLKSAELELKIAFRQHRMVGAWRVHDATCDVTKKGR